MEKLVKLNLGCGVYKIPEFINIDISENTNPDRIIDILKISDYYAKGSVDLVLLDNVLEHFEKMRSFSLLEQIRYILKPGGILHVIVPDFEWIAEQLLNVKHQKDSFIDYRLLHNLIFGSDLGHKEFYTRDRLEDRLIQAGFGIKYTKIIINHRHGGNHLDILAVKLE